MREVHGDLWVTGALLDAHIVITTNGDVRQDGAAVMGAGVAKQAAQRYPGLQQYLGLTLSEHGNHVHELMRLDPEANDPHLLMSFPVKHHWPNEASLKLIRRSCIELAYWHTLRCRVDVRRREDIYVLPRPGCGNGRLTWDRVRPIVKRHLPGRNFVVVNNQ